MQEFFKLGLSEEFSLYFKESELKKPTEVQRKVIPLFLEEESLIVLAQTGSGKTLSYALPLIHKVKHLEELGEFSDKGSPLVIVVLPTRELASQVYKVFKGISHTRKCRVRLLTGGDSHEKTKSIASAQIDILIATPNRLLSSVKRKEIKADLVQYLVLDEADQLMEMGFNKDINTLLGFIKKPELKFSLFSATMPTSINDLIEKQFTEQKFKKVILDNAHFLVPQVSTYNISVTPAQKHQMCKMFLEKTAVGRGMIFSNQKNLAENLATFLSEQKTKYKFKLLHGDLEKKEREEAINAFREGKVQFLVCTDIAARGIDISDLSWILNYDLPKNPTYYIHRTGRTGRMGAKGTVYNFVTMYDHKFIVGINDAIRKHKEVKLEMLPMAKPKIKTKSRD